MVRPLPSIRCAPAILRRCLAALMFASWAGGASPARAEQVTPADLNAGRSAYQQSCARCHGPEGRGDGVDATRFYPRPRDLSAGVYKFRSTASGTPPTDEDLFLTLTRGLPGSNMPDWQHLDERVRWQLVAYLKSLSPVFEERIPQPIAVAPDPGPKRVDLAKGKALYAQLGCAACHGESGRANGPSAATLVDDWEQPMRPANLTQGWNYRGWSDPQSIMLRVLSGIDGTPMPSYAEAVSGDDAWHLAYYVASLQEPPQWHLIASAARLEGALPSSLDDSRWAQAERTDVRLRNAVTTDGTWEMPATVTMVSFQALYNDEAIAWRFSWDDPTHDVQTPPDGFALILKPAGVAGDVVTLQAWPYHGSPPLDVCYWSADAAQATELVATDVGHVRTNQVAAPAALTSVAQYEEGRWQMVVQRPLHGAIREGAAVIPMEGLTAMAVMVWDGANPTARAISPWVDLTMGGTDQ